MIDTAIMLLEMSLALLVLAAVTNVLGDPD